MGAMPHKKNPTGEDRLWWAVVREAARDARYANRSTALDSVEWLTCSGCYLTSVLFHIPVVECYREVIKLIRERNRYHEEPIDLPHTPPR